MRAFLELRLMFIGGQVPEGHCWMGGDNIPESIDSKVYGPVPLALIRGKILARVFWPPKWFKSPFVRVEFDDEPEE